MKSIIILLFALILSTAATFAQKVTEDKVPAAAKSALKQKFPNAGKVEWEMENKDYEANFKVGKVETSAVFTAEGKWKETETEIENSAMPKAVTDAIMKQYPGSKIKESAKLETADKGSFYEADIDNKGKTWEVQVSAEGKILNSKEEKDKDEPKKK